MSTFSNAKEIASPEEKKVSLGVFSEISFWSFLPLFSLLASFGVTSLVKSPLNAYLPFACLLGVAGVFRWKRQGLVGFYLALVCVAFFFFKSIPSEARLWQIGAFFSIALSSYIALLSIEEIENIFRSLKNKAEDNESLLSQELENSRQASLNWSKEKESLEEEIRKLIEEAKQRRIEKASDDRKLFLVQTEIEMLTSQKEQWLKESFEARSFAAESLRKAEEALKEREFFALQIEPLKKEQEAKKALLIQVDEQKAVLEQLQKEISQEREEKENIAQSRQILIGQWSELKEENERLTLKVEELFHQLEEKKKEVEALEETKKSLVASEEFVGLKREKAKFEGLYKQLRQQFDEKTHHLSQTRKELFQLQESLLALQHVKSEEAIEPPLFFNEALAELEHQNADLETEIIALEALVSQLLSR